MILTDIKQAAEQINPYIHHTPLLCNNTLSQLLNREVRLKTENLQRAGSFKIRGAMNKLLSLSDEERARGVVAFSSGNHAQGVALAARFLGVKATIVMPEDAVAIKVAATKDYGAEVVQSGVDVATRGQVAKDIVNQTGATLIPPFDDPFIVAGQGTVGLEIFQDWPTVDTVITPLGGGGLLSGTALALTELNPKIRVYGVEPEAGNDGQQSLQNGKIVTIEPPHTIADGARTTAIGELPFTIIQSCVEDIFTVPDETLLATIKLLALRCKLVVEPTGALALAALLTGKIPDNGKTVVVLSGGNITPHTLAQAMVVEDMF